MHVGLVFVALVQAPHEELGAGLEGFLAEHPHGLVVAVAGRFTGQFGGEGRAHFLLDGLHLVAFDHVGDFVRKHGGQFAFVAQPVVKALGDQDGAAGQGEGVDVGAVHHAEAPGQVGPFGLQGQPQADAVHVLLHGVVAHQRTGGQQAGGDAAAEFDFVFVGDRCSGVGGLLAELEEFFGVTQATKAGGGRSQGQRNQRSQEMSGFHRCFLRLRRSDLR